MSSFATVRGARRELEQRYQGVAAPSGYFMALVTAAVAPSQDSILFSALTEIAAGNGYTAGGLALSLNTTDFPTITEDLGADKAVLTIRDIVYTAAGGPLPASGGGARYAVLLGPHATPGSREIIHAWDLGADQSVSATQPLTLAGFKIERRALSI